MTVSRRDALRLGLAAGASLLLPAGLMACSGGGGGGLGGGANVGTQGSAGRLLKSQAPLPEPFGVPLPVPPVLRPVRSDGTGDHYEITQKAAQVEILPGMRTEVWGYNGIFPGPTIESRRGRRTVVTHHNKLPVPVVVHLHGGKTPPEHDGYPTDMITPVGGWTAGHDAHGTHGMHQGAKEYVYPVDQPASTLWYHDHRMDFTGPQVYKGLAGFHLIRDDEEERLGLPHGKRDIPLMICDRAFAADGSFDYPAVDPTLRDTPGTSGDFISGVLGDCILVNGAPWPQLEVTNTRYRFRILNASNARRYELALDPRPGSGPPFVQIGSDQGLLAQPVAHDTIKIAQAERFDVVIDFSRYAVGEQVTLTNEHGRGDTSKVMRFVVARSGPDDSQLPGNLVASRRLRPSEATVRRDLVFARGGAQAHGMTLWTINGEPFHPDRIHADPRLGTVELWKVRAQNVEHPIHLHLAPFQVLSIGGNDPGPFNQGWKDTVNLDNGDYAELLVNFDSFKGKYVFHCHNLEHEDMQMMGNFQVI
jgi:spore coat protein A, manganese oxidase